MLKIRWKIEKKNSVKEILVAYVILYIKSNAHGAARKFKARVVTGGILQLPKKTSHQYMHQL